jgi:RNA polymerase sigma-70 factor (ECF subfamily)
MDHLRRRRSRPVPAALDLDLLELRGPDTTDDQALEVLSTRRALELVRGLPRDQAEAVLLRVVIGLDGPAAARVLGKRPGAVRTAAYRGLKRLARQLGASDVTEKGAHTLGQSK